MKEVREDVLIHLVQISGEPSLDENNLILTLSRLELLSYSQYKIISPYMLKTSMYESLSALCIGKINIETWNILIEQDVIKY